MSVEPDHRGEADLHVGGLRDVGVGKEPIFIRYLRRLGETETRDEIFHCDLKVQSDIYKC